MAKNLIQNNCDLVTTTPETASAQLVSAQALVLCQSSSTTALTQDFLNLAQYPYTNFMLTYNVVYSAVNSGEVFMRVSTNNGASFIASGYQSGTGYISFNGSNLSNASSTSTIQMNCPTFAGSSSIISAEIYLYGLNSGTGTITCTAYSYSSNAGTNSYPSVSTSIITAGAAVNALRLVSSVGTVSVAKYNLWGING